MENIKKVHGPYLRKDGRKHVIICYYDGTKRTVSYPKYLMELKLGRRLDKDLETVDHIDGDLTNNDINNLEILTRRKHAKKDAWYAKEIKCNCPYCGNRYIC